MKKNFLLLFAAAFLLSIVSCSKSDDTNTPTNSNITGTWNFSGLHVETTQTSQSTVGTDILKTVTTSNYNTISNAGTLKIDASNWMGNNLTYSLDTRILSMEYENGVFLDSFSLPVTYTLPAFSNTAAYTRVNNDSVYFPNGATFFGGVSGASEPSGARISLSGNQLIMTQSQNQTEYDSATGTTTLIKAAVMATFQK